MKTWHAAIASLGTAAFLVAAYIAVLSVSGALFAFTDLSTAGTAEQVPPLKTVVAVKPVKVKPVVARAPEPEPDPEPAPVETSLVEPAPPGAGGAAAQGTGNDESDGGSLPGAGDPSGGNGGGNSGSGGEDGGEGEDRDDAALLSEEGVNASGPVKKVTDDVNKALDRTVGKDLKQVTDPVTKAIDHLERGLGLDGQGR